MTFPNRSDENALDIEQEKRRQARQASAYARGESEELPSFATKGPDRRVADGELDDIPEQPQRPEESEQSEQEVTPEAPVENPTESPVEETEPPVEESEPVDDGSQVQEPNS